MSFADVRSAIEGRFEAQWGSTTPVKWQNIPFRQPDPPAPWVALFILHGDGTQISLESNPLHRFAGVIMVQVYVPEKTGTDRALELADQVAAVWRSPTTHQGIQLAAGVNGSVTCRTSSVANLGTENGWHGVVATTPFKFDKRYG